MVFLITIEFHSFNNIFYNHLQQSQQVQVIPLVRKTRKISRCKHTMNDEGTRYLKHVHNLCQGFKFERKFKWTDSIFQERLLRFGREMKLFAIDIDETDDIEMCIIASLKEDIVLRKKNNG